jgi:hypothetical protein
MCRKGYGPSLKRGKAHRFFDYCVDGEPAVRTCVSHGGSKDLDDNLIFQMSKECHLKKGEFIDFATCRMSAEKYRQILIDKGIIPGP